jgi:hypothetical protein
MGKAPLRRWSDYTPILSDAQQKSGSGVGQSRLKSASPLVESSLSSALSAAAAEQSREGNFVDLAAVGALEGIVLGPFLPQLGQLLSNGRFVHVELTTAVKTGHRFHEISPCRLTITLPKRQSLI